VFKSFHSKEASRRAQEGRRNYHNGVAVDDGKPQNPAERVAESLKNRKKIIGRVARMKS